MIVKALHHFDESRWRSVGGAHRIVLVDDNGYKHAGDWFPYQQPATLKWDEKLFVAFSEYWLGTFPCNRVLQVISIPGVDTPAHAVYNLEDE